MQPVPSHLYRSRALHNDNWTLVEIQQLHLNVVQSFCLKLDRTNVTAGMSP